MLTLTDIESNHLVFFSFPYSEPYKKHDPIQGSFVDNLHRLSSCRLNSNVLQADL